MSPSQGLYLYALDFFTAFACLRCCVPKKYKKDKLLKLYNEGNNLLVKEFNIAKIIKNLRYFRIVMHNYVVQHDDEIDFAIKYH